MTDSEFEKIFKEYFKSLTNIAYSVVKDEDSAKDIVQQVFVKLWQRKDVIEFRGKVKSYLHRAVVNTSLSHLEKYSKIKLDDLLSDRYNNYEEQEMPIQPQEKLEQEIKRAISKLPTKCNLVFSLSRFSGMTNAEIAENLEISIKAVEKHIGKALKALRISLRPLYDSIILCTIINILNKIIYVLG